MNLGRNINCDSETGWLLTCLLKEKLAKAQRTGKADITLPPTSIEVRKFTLEGQGLHTSAIAKQVGVLGDWTCSWTICGRVTLFPKKHRSGQFAYWKAKFLPSMSMIVG